MRKGDLKERLLITLVDRPMPLLHDAYARIVELEAVIRDIRAKVHAHNRGGEMYAGLRDVIRDICDEALNRSD